MTERKVLRKVCMLGEFAVGKTNLASRFTQNTFNEKYLTTMGARVSKKEVQLGEYHITMMVWDLIGFIKYDKLIQSYAKGSDAGMIVFDVTREETFEAVEKWANIFINGKEHKTLVILGNKTDLGNKFDAKARGEELAKKNGWRFFLTSAKSGLNVEDAFLSVAVLD
jgi:small GTP-binding protein